MATAVDEETQKSFSNEKITRLEMEKELVTNLHDTYEKLTKLWQCIGFPQENCYKRLRIVLYHVNLLFDQLINEEESLLKKLKDSLESCTLEIMKLCEELTVSQYEPREGLSLLELENVLRTKTDELMKEKVRRLRTLQELQEKEKPLCLSLDMSIYSIASTVPTHEELKELEQHIAMLQDEQRRRLNKFHELKENILEAVENLESTPQSVLEKEVAYAKDEDVLLSDKNLISIRNLYDQLLAKCSDREKHTQEQRNKLHTLWNCLKVGKEEREAFLAKHEGYKKSVIDGLNAEVRRCEELKRQNMEEFVRNAREHLSRLWNSCYVSDEQKKKFTAYNDDNYSEDLLTLHEQEVSKWEACWLKFRDLFTGVDKLKRLWQEVKEFEKKARDPNRFTNRGGGLLQEEKERKKLIKSLPILQEKLAVLACDWEKENGTTFLVQGVALNEFMARYWEDHNQEKENEKLLRKQKHDADLSRRTVKRSRTPGTPLVLASNAKRIKYTPSGSVYRTPASGAHKMQKSAKSNKMMKGRLLETSGAVSGPSLVSISSYTDFKHDLNQTLRTNCRSTLVPTPNRFLCGQVGQAARDRTVLRRSQRIKMNLSKKLGRSTTSRSPKLTTPVRNKNLPILF